jgi:hypothetical protein
MAILGGMATAAAVVLFQALHLANDPVRTAAGGTSSSSAKPSAFGTFSSSSTPPDAKLSPAQIAKSGNRTIVTVTGYNEDDKPVAQGAGFVYSSSGVIVTSFSAIRGASSVTVDTSSGEELNVIALMGYNVSRDLAVLAVLESNLPSLENGAEEVVQEGDHVVVLKAGNATAEGVVGYRRAVNGVDMIQVETDAAIGSPVVNQHGKVVAVMARKNLAIPSHYVSDMMNEKEPISFAQMLEETQNGASAGKEQK